MQQDTVTYQSTVDGIESSQLTGFFVGWPSHPTPAKHLDILQASHGVELAIDTSSGQVVGFINVVSDGVFTGYIPLLEVLPEYQGLGIGGKLINRIAERYKHLYMLDVCCDEDIVPVYRSRGFTQVAGVVRRNYDRQTAE